MKKRLIAFTALLVICITIACPLFVSAITPLDPNAKAELTLNYKKDGIAFPDQEISIYRIAQAFPDGTFSLIEPFSFYPVNIHNVMMQEQWANVASTLNSYIVADKISPDRTEKTNAEGKAEFAELMTGLYFVQEVVAENSNGTYIFNQFMVYVPTPQSDGTYDYSVEANPKCTEFMPKTQYTVTKLWQDEGNRDKRPAEVEVEIYKNGELQETKVLNADNNWTYTWQVAYDDHSKWTVAEKSVNEPYKVTVQQNGNTFTVINTYESLPDAPQTGNTFTPIPWILAMCLAGVVLLSYGIYRWRRA